MRVKALVFDGLGIGCQEELAEGFKRAGALTDIVHFNDVFKGIVDIRNYHILDFPGGFLQSDYLGAAKAMANQIEHVPVRVDGRDRRFMDIVRDFIDNGGQIFGQCNGFQLMVKLGLLPGWDNYTRQVATLDFNDSGKYEVRWVLHKVNQDARCAAYRGIEYMMLPCRHGEGRFIIDSEWGQVSKEEAEETRQRLHADNHILLQYAHPETRQPTMDFPYNPNKSLDSIAGLVDSTGQVFGHMAHPEAYLLFANNPRWTRLKEKYKRYGQDIPEEGAGLWVFENIVEKARENL